MTIYIGGIGAHLAPWMGTYSSEQLNMMTEIYVESLESFLKDLASLLPVSTKPMINHEGL